MKNSSIIDSKLMIELGVLDWGYTEEPIPISLHRFENWVNDSLHGSLTYLSDHRRHLRRDLRHVYPEFKSALVFLFSYQSAKKWMLENHQHSLASYTLGFGGEDYHLALKDKLKKIISTLNVPGLEFFFSVDAQPIMERDLAFRAGLGWFGKNSMLIHKKEGSYFLIGSILLNQKLPIDESPIDVDHCGQCTACAESCPTKAINLETRTLIADRCISTYTIELFKSAPPPEGLNQSRGEIFGCDICQDVCPWNRKPLKRVISELKLKESYSFLKEWFYEWPRKNLEEFILKQSSRGFRKKLYGTPFDRPGKWGWLKNLKAISNQSDLSKNYKDRELQNLAHDEEDV
jgi:epoxyqueuosine reductase